MPFQPIDLSQPRPLFSPPSTGNPGNNINMNTNGNLNNNGNHMNNPPNGNQLNSNNNPKPLNNNQEAAAVPNQMLGPQKPPSFFNPDDMDRTRFINTAYPPQPNNKEEQQPFTIPPKLAKELREQGKAQNNTRKDAIRERWERGEWTGLPLSPGNYLFVNVTEMKNEQYVEKFFDEVRVLSAVEMSNNDILFPIYDRYLPLIGVNSFVDVFNTHFHDDLVNVTSPVIHALGEYIYSKSKANIQYGLEVTTRGILLNAPLHGFIWSVISDVFDENSDPNEIFRFVDERICYFKNYTSMASIYISCIHGVGHGLENIFGNYTERAIQVCTKNNNKDFQYTCATGVYMSAVTRYLGSVVDPCMERFPAACFRFKDFLPCDQIRSTSKYHEIGCVWGQSYLEDFNKPHNVAVYCSRYLPAPFNTSFSYLSSPKTTPMFPNKAGARPQGNAGKPPNGGQVHHRDLDLFDPSVQMKLLNQNSYEYDLYSACVDGYLASHPMYSIPFPIANYTCSFVVGDKARSICLASAVNNLDYDSDDLFQWNSVLLEKYYNPSFSYPIRHPTPEETEFLEERHHAAAAVLDGGDDSHNHTD